MLKSSSCLVLLCILLNPAASSRAAWPPVPPVDWTHIKLSDFADNELDIPYLMEHLHTVANAVIEDGPNRGFLNIAVNRRIPDNQPYNARIQETNRALAYFYCTRKPWNPYYDSEALKVRLEAMLNFWCNEQNPDGLFAEYSPTNFSLAPTGFGVQAMAQTLTLLGNGGPTIDPDILKRTTAAQRKAIMHLLTQEDSFKWASEFSNQISGVYSAALKYLRLNDDPEMRAALDAGAKRVISITQSPTGLLYEGGGLDFGYSNVHLNNIRLAWPFISDDPTLRSLIIDEDKLWNHWLSYNLVLAPDRSGYFINAGVNCRTSHAFATYKSKPTADVVENSRCFAMTGPEWQASMDAKRAELAATWPHFKPLEVPSEHSYNSESIDAAMIPLDTWFPTAQQRDASIALLPYLANTNWTTQAFDPRGYVFTYIRRPTFYAIMNTGRLRQPKKQNLGLGLLWNDNLGCVLQSVGLTDIAWGTVAGPTTRPAETHTIDATITAAGNAITPSAGYANLPDGPAIFDYPLPDGGTKHISMDADGITVSITKPGDFHEQFPLVKSHDDTFTTAPGKIELKHGPTTFTITFDPTLNPALSDATPFEENKAFDRVLATLSATGKLEYRMSFETITKP